MKNHKRTEGDYNLSFLDVICCGFGAIILLLMITKIVEPVVIEESAVEMEGSIRDLQEKLFQLRGDTRKLDRELTAKKEQLSENKEKVARLKSDIESFNSQFNNSEDQTEINEILKGKLADARQTLTDEMRRLQIRSPRIENQVIGGIPVDSEYIIFIIDTSGSMFSNAWPRVQREIINTLDIYPKVKGIQVMNDNGDYMYSNYRGKWIPDTKGRRNAIINRLRTWSPFSNSSPVEGVTKAIRTFYAKDKKISIYVFGDDFSGGSIENVVKTIDNYNRNNKTGKGLVRIHGVGFPVLFDPSRGNLARGARFATLMREMTYQNGGTFVGLNDYR